MIEDQPITRSTPPTRRVITVLLGALVLAAALAFGVWRFAAADTNAAQYHPPHPPVALPALYYETAREQIAQGLGLSVARVAAEIHAHPDQGIFGVAGGQGLSPNQLHTLEIGALQAAGAAEVAAGMWTPQQDSATLAYWQARDAKSLGADITTWFQNQ